MDFESAQRATKEAATARGGGGSPSPSPSHVRHLLSLQRTIGNRATADILQRKITMKDGTTYDGAENAPAVIAKINGEVPGGWEKPLGGTLAKMLNSGDHGPYKSYSELLDAVKARRAAGTQAQERGKAREEHVADTSGGKVADEGRYGQDLTVHLPGSDRHVKLDNIGPTYYAITGGPAKAGNLPKFRSICGDLKAISEAFGKQPRVYCTADTPKSVVDIAKKVVGAENVYEVESGEVWRDINPYALDMPDYGKEVPMDPKTGLPAGAMPYIT